GFLEDVREMKQKNLAVELLRKLLNDEIGSRARTNVVEQQQFSERLKQALLKYQNRSVETALVIEEMLAIARDLKQAAQRGEHLGLTDDELAFYDALGGADMATIMGDDQLFTIAREVANTVRANASIDWTIQESVRANMRRMVRRVLRRHGYPPDRQEDATGTIIRQAELLTAAQAP
ncbi:MAG: DUF3387 domain-containing protein, partial [Chloroflexota bacterium]|nr:DUF3387 domain-containing protein [Chloroflexota bacterium]